MMFDSYKNKQSIAYNILNNALVKNEYNHAYLIETNGYDEAFEFIISFIKKIFTTKCINDYGRISQMIDDDNYPELRIINPDGSWIKKEQLTRLQDEFSKKPIIGNKKVYIINSADRLNSIAGNSILKFLEEPQEGIIAFLLCDNRYKLLDTIVSRCQIISLNGQTDLNDKLDTFSKLGQLITKNKEEYSQFITDEINREKLSAIIEFVKYYENNGKKVIYYINKYWNSNFQNKEMYKFGLIGLLSFYKDLLNYKLGNKIIIFNDYENEIKHFSINNDIEKLITKINALNHAIEKLDYNANLSLLMDKLIIEMEGE